MNYSLLRLALIILGVGFLMCLGGIIYLASANPARPIPDILVGTTTLIVGAIVGVLVPNRLPAAPEPAVEEEPQHRGELGNASLDLVIKVIAIVVLVLVVIVLLGAVTGGR